MYGGEKISMVAQQLKKYAGCEEANVIVDEEKML